jgi:diguanylate cyclase (GGDEF)-like protein/PAS domain S-box-containing protein
MAEDPTSVVSPAVRATARRAVPVLIGIVVIVAIGSVAWRVGVSNLAIAEQDRLDLRAHAVAGVGRNVARDHDPNIKAGHAATTPFVPGAAGLNAVLLGAFHFSDDPGSYAGLIRVDGVAEASLPSGTTIDVADLGTAWHDAVGGRATVSDAFRRDGAVVNATLVPVGSPTPWAVMVTVEPALGSVGQDYHEQMGSLNSEPGGLVLVDRQGVALNSWSRDELGRPVVPAADVAALPTDLPRVWTGYRDGAEETFVGVGVGQGYGLVFEQDTAKLYGDLEAAQHSRDLTLVAVLAVALAALVGFQLARELDARRAEAKVHSLLKNSQDLVLVVGADTDLRFVSPAIDSLLGRPAETWIGTRLTDWCHSGDESAIRHLVDHPGSGPLLNIRLQGADGRHRWFDVEASDLTDRAEVGGVLLTCHEIGGRKALQDELTHQATHDRLTGLPNRAQFNQRLENLLSGGQPLRPFALLYLDLDRFKPVNDTLGHEAGDHVLIVVSERLQAVAGPGGFVSRLGGDEFAILLDGADENRAGRVADAILSVARAPIAIGTRLAQIDASIGIAIADRTIGIHNAEQLVRAADQAMYQAKQHGRGRVAFASLPASTPIAPDTAVVTTTPTGRRPDGDVAHRATSTPAPMTAVGPRGHRLAALAPVAIATALVMGTAGLGHHQSSHSQRAAEAERLTAQTKLVVHAANLYAKLLGPAALTRTVATAPFAVDGSGVDQAIVRGIADAPASGRDAVAFLARPDGHVLATSRPDLTLRIPTSAPAWRAALQGRGAAVPAVADTDQGRTYYVLPVIRESRTVAVLAFGLSLRHGPGQTALENGGNAGYGTGGWSMVDGDGTVYMSWNPGFIGDHLVDPTALSGLEPDTSRDLSNDTNVLIAAPMIAGEEPTFLVFTMPTAEFQRDLRAGELQRTLTLAAVVALAVAGLAFVNGRREQAVRRSEARLDALLQAAHDIVVVLDGDDHVTFVSSAVVHLLGYSRDDYDLMAFIHETDRSRLDTLVSDAHARGAASITDIRILHADGEYRWFDIDAVDLRGNREVHGILLTGHEVTERRELQQQLEHRARHDPLTGLPNRSMLAERLTRLATPDAGRFAVLFIDLDHFKPVNDTLGHDIGDEVLRITARRLLANSRSGAGAGTGDDVVCRLGGDEFAVILGNVTEPLARATAERLIAAAAEPITIGDHTIHIGATIGICVSDATVEDPDIALRRADHAMYQAKEEGRNRYVIAGVGH